MRADETWRKSSQAWKHLAVAEAGVVLRPAQPFFHREPSGCPTAEGTSTQQSSSQIVTGCANRHPQARTGIASALLLRTTRSKPNRRTRRRLRLTLREYLCAE